MGSVLGEAWKEVVGEASASSPLACKCALIVMVAGGDTVGRESREIWICTCNMVEALVRPMKLDAKWGRGCG